MDLDKQANTSISIHALREEGDRSRNRPKPRNRIFLSTPSARRATLARETRRAPWEISIHALREEGDPVISPTMSILSKFLSTPSARRATPPGKASSMMI